MWRRLPETARRPLMLVTAVAGACYFAAFSSPPENNIPTICGAVGDLGLRDLPLLLGPGFSAAALLASWSFMVAAMMSPLVLRPLLAISASRKGVTSLTAFLAAYISVWIAMAVWIIPLAIMLIVSLGRPIALILTTLFAVAWSMSPFCQFLRNNCHRADWTAGAVRGVGWGHVQQGFHYAIWCCGTCWPWMAVGSLLEANHILWMALISGFLLADRAMAPTTPRWQILPVMQIARARLRPQKVLGRP